MKILLLEDNQSFAETLQIVFMTKGHQVEHTSTIQQAIELFNTREFDAVITDIHLKDEFSKSGSGFELIRHIRHKIKSSVVVAVTTGMDLIEKTEVLKRGADIFHHKPIRVGFDSFIREIEAQVNARREKAD